MGGMQLVLIAVGVIGLLVIGGIAVAIAVTVGLAGAKRARQMDPPPMERQEEQTMDT